MLTAHVFLPFQNFCCRLKVGHSYNVFLTVVMLGIIPILYVINVWRKVKHEIIFSVFLGPLIAVEYLLAVFWFVLTFPFWLINEVSAVLQTGSFLTEGIWILHGVAYAGFILSYFIVPNWIKHTIEDFTRTYADLKSDQYDLVRSAVHHRRWRSPISGPVGR